MANTLANIARVVSATTGTGTLTLGSAVTGFNTFADAGLTDGQTVTYAIEDYTGSDVTAREVGTGVFNTAGPTLTRATVYSSTSGGAKINCSGSQQVFITVSKEDLATYLTSAAAASTYQPLDSDLTTLAANITAFGHSLVDDANAAAARATLGLGTMATETATDYLTTAAAAAGYQPLDSDLTSIAALTTAAYGRSLLETTSEANFKAAVNLEIGTDVQAQDAELSAIAGLTSAADRLAYFTGSGTASLATFTAAGRALIDDADASAQRTTLGLGTAAIQNTGTSGANVPLLNGANTWSGQQIVDLTGIGSPLANGMVVQGTEDGAGAGPGVLVRRISASPAASDQIGFFQFQGRDSAGNNTIYGALGGTITDPTDTSEDGGFLMTTMVAGAAGTTQLTITNGVAAGAPTGGVQGNGTINAVTLYENGTSLASKYGALASANVFTAAQTVRIDNASTNSVTVAQTLSHTTTGTPATGIGVALNFEAETAAGNNEIGAQISAVTTDVTSTSEDFDLVFSAMAAGAAVAEVGRITSKGTYKHKSFTVAGLPAGTAGETCFASNGRKNGEGAGAGTGVLVFHDGTNWCACDTGAAVAA